MIDVAHEGDDGSAQFELLLLHFLHDLGDGFADDFLDLMDASTFFALLPFEAEAMLFTDFLGDFDLDGFLRIRNENFQRDEIRDDFKGPKTHLFREFADNERWLEMDDFFTRLVEFKLHWLRLGFDHNGWRRCGGDYRWTRLFEHGDRPQSTCGLIVRRTSFDLGLAFLLKDVECLPFGVIDRLPGWLRGGFHNDLLRSRFGPKRWQRCIGVLARYPLFWFHILNQ